MKRLAQKLKKKESWFIFFIISLLTILYPILTTPNLSSNTNLILSIFGIWLCIIFFIFLFTKLEK
jgi:hypothetical protein